MPDALDPVFLPLADMPEITFVIDISAALPFTVRLVGAFVAPPSVINPPNFPAQIQPPLV